MSRKVKLTGVQWPSTIYKKRIDCDSSSLAMTKNILQVILLYHAIRAIKCETWKRLREYDTTSSYMHDANFKVYNLPYLRLGERSKWRHPKDGDSLVGTTFKKNTLSTVEVLTFLVSLNIPSN